jgi:hypothetical protein
MHPTRAIHPISNSLTPTEDEAGEGMEDRVEAVDEAADERINSQQISTTNQLRAPYHAGQQQQLAQKQPYSHTTKYWKNRNYCWTCGYDVPDWHTSATCPIPQQGHVYYKMHKNPCNGSNKARHKVNM